jgi:hypothetical protein
MATSGPICQPLLKFAAIVSLGVPAFSQATPKYDPTSETTFKGVVQELKLVPPTGAKPIAYLVLRSPAAGQIFLCPKKFLDDIGVAFKADDAIEVTGSKVKQDGADLTLAREVVKNGETLTLRFKDGKPVW